jgi:hypothetical protein
LARDPRVLPLRGKPLLRRLLLSEAMGKPRGLQPWRPRTVVSGAPPEPPAPTTTASGGDSGKGG